jgi:hypothetical protein
LISNTEKMQRSGANARLLAPNLAKDLLEKGAEPEAVNQIANQFIKTGQINVPSMQTKALPYDPEVPQGRSTQVPFQLNKKKAGLYSFNQDTGQYEQTPTPEDVDSFEVRSFSPTKASKTQGYTIYLDPDGKEMRREPNNNGKDVIVKTTARSGSGKGPQFKDPRDALAFNVITKYSGALANRDRVSNEFKDSAQSAAQRFNIDLVDLENNPALIDEMQQEPSFLQRLLGQTPEPPAPKPPHAALKFPPPGQRPAAPAAKPPPQGGKPLTPELAQEFLKQAGGDKDKARALAKQAGYGF